MTAVLHRPDTRTRRQEALSRPATRRVADALASADHPLTAQQVADQLGLHHSGVRGHLNALVLAGVAESTTQQPQGRGRPRTLYTLTPDPDAQEAEGHRELVRLLMNLVNRMGLGPEDMESFGEGQGTTIPRPGGGADELRDAFARLGFAPREVPGPPPRDLVLDRCPFAAGVEAVGGELICVLHRGLAKGIAATACPDVRVRELIEQDPRIAGCRLRLEAVPR